MGFAFARVVLAQHLRVVGVQFADTGGGLRVALPGAQSVLGQAQEDALAAYFKGR